MTQFRRSVAARTGAALLLAAVVGIPDPAVAAPSRTPTDRLVDSQWHLFGGGIDVRSVWAERVTGGPVVVAVIDSGIDLDHEDLEPNLWTNPGEIAGNGIDDDRNGVVDDVHGADIVDGDGNPDDLEGHGTHVAGVIAARGNNRRGVAGVAWRARLMSVRVLDRKRSGTTRDLALGIVYAVRNGARIINISANTSTNSTMVARALAVASDAGVLVVASAGNEGANLAAAPSYPACTPSVMGVASSGRQRRLSRFSSYGGGCVDLAAPGERIMSTRRGGGYGLRTGSSMSSAQVAGAAVLLLAARPTLSGVALRRALVVGARNGLRGGGAGAGTLSVARAYGVTHRR